MTRAGLVAVVGPPGAGKSTWRRGWLRDHPGTTVVSLDDNRRALGCCSANQELTPLAVQMGVVAARSALARGGIVVWDATNAEKAARMLLLVVAAEHQARTTAVILLPTLAVALDRNAGRDARPCWCGYARRVPDAVVSGMHAEITRDLLTIPAEGWNRVRRTAFAELISRPKSRCALDSSSADLR